MWLVVSLFNLTPTLSNIRRLSCMIINQQKPTWLKRWCVVKWKEQSPLSFLVPLNVIVTWLPVVMMIHQITGQKIFLLLLIYVYDPNWSGFLLSVSDTRVCRFVDQTYILCVMVDLIYTHIPLVVVPRVMNCTTTLFAATWRRHLPQEGVIKSWRAANKQLLSLGWRYE